MSITGPVTPNLSGASIKSFWKRPEGTTGMVVLAVVVLASLWGLAILLPLIEFVLANTIYTIFLACVLGAILYVLFNKRFRTLMSYMFKSFMRRLTSIFITIDPIGILKSKIDEMKEQEANLQSQISNLAGAQQTLKDNILANTTAANKCDSIAAQARRQQESSKDPIEKSNMVYKIQENVSEAARRREGNKSLQDLAVKLDRIYSVLIRWDQATRFYINDRENQVKFYKTQYKAMNAGFSAMQSAKRILAGNADSDALYNETLEFLAEDASTKAGEMSDFARTAESFMADIDLENGAAAHDALEKLEAMSTKLLPASSETPGFMDAMSGSQPVLEAVPVRKSLSAQSGYEDIFNKK